MAFKVEVTEKNIEITERIQTYIDKKTQKLDRLLNDITDVHVNISFSQSVRHADDRHVAEITIHGKGYILRAEERASDVFIAIDNAMEKLQRQIERFKGKRAHTRGTDQQIENMEAEQTGKPPSKKPLIARRKYFNLVPMDEMEAIEQMELLGHENFFVFHNANTNAINILYVRRDGSYGLIEPRME
jgi:putative sigma-54 modulation protein